MDSVVKIFSSNRIKMYKYTDNRLITKKMVKRLIERVARQWAIDPKELQYEYVSGVSEDSTHRG